MGVPTCGTHRPGDGVAPGTGRKKFLVVLVSCLVVAAAAVLAAVLAAQNASPVERARAAQVGATVTFGSWEQDGDASNGAEPVEWLVLDRQGGHVLLLAKQALATRPYDDGAADGATWESSSLRAWLNGAFYDGAFTAEERGAVQLSAIANPGNADHGTPGCGETQDRVFLLSLAEVGAYCADEAVRTCTPAQVAVDQGAWVSDDNGCVDWWLRSPGADPSRAADVGTDGLVYANGYPVGNADVGVRPALWL